MQRDPRKYLYDMLSACEFLLKFTADRSVEDYRSDRGFRSAVERELQIIGEALLQLERLSPPLAAEIPDYRRIIGFRHVLVHGYDSLDPATVWSIVTGKLVPLEQQLRKMLEAES